MLLDASGHCDEQAVIAGRRRRGQGDDVQKRAARAELKVSLVSSARQALEKKGEEVSARHQRDDVAVDGRVTTSSTVEGRSAS